jgi:hypothetical protein
MNRINVVEKSPVEDFYILDGFEKILGYYPWEPLGFSQLWEMYPDSKTITRLLNEGIVSTGKKKLDANLMHILDEGENDKKKRLEPFNLVITGRGKEIQRLFDLLSQEQQESILKRGAAKANRIRWSHDKLVYTEARKTETDPKKRAKYEFKLKELQEDLKDLSNGQTI